MNMDYEEFINQTLREMGLTDEQIIEAFEMCEYMCNEVEEN